MSPAAPEDLALELRGLRKAYGACVANRDISLRVAKGSIHAVIGENGAGKSTAMKMAYGMVPPDSGEILVGGKAVHFRSPRAAAAAGIGMVHQHFMLAPPHSGLDNILLGAEPLPAGLTRWPRALTLFLPIARRNALAHLQALAKTYRFNVDFTKNVADLPVGVQQRLEILKLLYRSASILILDEPTAVLTPQEADELFANLRRLRDEGRTIIIITHKLKEVMRLADRVTVFRQGTVVAERRVAETTENELAALMVGRAVRLEAHTGKAPELGPSALKLAGITVRRGHEKPRLAAVNIEVRGGEIVGVAGVEGNGQSELLDLIGRPNVYFARHLFGSQLSASGELGILGRDARRLSARAVRDLGLGFVPEDRHRQGLVLSFSLEENFLLGLEHQARFSSRLGWIKQKAVRAAFISSAAEFDVRPPDPTEKARALSGGNQQKIVLAREFARSPRALVFAQPTRGVDVGSIEFIHSRIVNARNEGAGVLLVSSSLEEILALSDRILVMFEGRIVAEFARGSADETTVGRAMAGVTGMNAERSAPQ